eukprot:1720683-Amphidinium_carterae.1
MLSDGTGRGGDEDQKIHIGGHEGVEEDCANANYADADPTATPESDSYAFRASRHTSEEFALCVSWSRH